MKKIKVLGAGVSLALCLSLLTGCDFLPPRNAVELMQRSAEAMSNADNYRMAMDMAINMSVEANMEGVGMDMTIPVDFGMKIDRFGNYMFGDMDVDAKMNATVSFMGESETMSESMDESAEVYFVIDGTDMTSYINDGGSGWIVNEDADGDAFAIDGLLSIDAERDVFANAEMEKQDGIYVVKMSLAEALEDDAFVEFMENSMDTDMFNGANIDWSDFADAVGDARIVYTFDAKTYHLLKVEMADIEIDDISFVSGMDGMDFDGMNIDDVLMTMNMSVEFSKFGKIEESDVKVPESVIKEATSVEDVVVEDDINVEVSDNETDDVDVSDVELPSNHFIYDGKSLSMPMDYQMFVDDGWYPVDEGDYSSFVLMQNDKYENVYLYLNTNDGDGTTAYLKEHGADGFSISVDDGECPPFAFAGLTFGDKSEKVLAALGDPDSMNSYSSSAGTTLMYEWEIEYSGLECYLSISFWNDELCEFSLSYWG